MKCIYKVVQDLTNVIQYPTISIPSLSLSPFSLQPLPCLSIVDIFFSRCVCVCLFLSVSLCFCFSYWISPPLFLFKHYVCNIVTEEVFKNITLYHIIHITLYHITLSAPSSWLEWSFSNIIIIMVSFLP